MAEPIPDFYSRLNITLIILLMKHNVYGLFFADIVYLIFKPE